MAHARRINQFCPEYTVSGCITGQSLEYGGIHMTGERADRLGKKIISVLTSGTLGIPGVGLLYGIMCYQIL